MIRNEYSKQFTFHSEKFKGVIPKLLPSYFSLFVWRYWWCEPKQMCFCCMAEPQASVASLSSGLLMGRGVVLREYLWMDVKKIKQEKTKTVFNVDLKAFPSPTFFYLLDLLRPSIQTPLWCEENKKDFYFEHVKYEMFIIHLLFIRQIYWGNNMTFPSYLLQSISVHNPVMTEASLSWTSKGPSHSNNH